MKSWSIAITSMVLSGCLLSTGGCTSPDAGDSPAAVDALLVQRLEKFSEMEEKGTPAEELARLNYWPEALLTGEGVDKAARGLDEVAAILKATGSELGKCRHASYDPIVFAGRMASQVFEGTCEPPDGKPVQKFRVLYVWEKRGEEWKIIREMFVSGALR